MSFETTLPKKIAGKIQPAVRLIYELVLSTWHKKVQWRIFQIFFGFRLAIKVCMHHVSKVTLSNLPVTRLARFARSARNLRHVR